MSFANLFHFIRLKISNCVDDSQEDVSSTGDINKQGHNYTSKSTKNWSDFVYTCEGSTAKCKVTCTECNQTADATVTASTFTNKTDRTCTAGETGNVTFTAKIKNPRTKDTSATTLVGTSETYKTAKVACATHTALGHKKSTTAYETIAATCTVASTEKWRCVRYNQGGCKQTFDDTHNTAALGHNYTDSTNYINDNYKASNATCSKKAEYWYACSRCGDSAKGKTSGTGNPNKTFGYGNLRQHDWTNKANAELAYTAKNCKEYNQYYYRCSYSDCLASAKNIDSSKKFNSGIGPHSFTKWVNVASYTNKKDIKDQTSDNVDTYRDAYVKYRNAKTKGYNIPDITKSAFKNCGASSSEACLKIYNHNGNAVCPDETWYPASGNASGCIYLLGETDSNGGSHAKRVTLSTDKKYRVREWATIYRSTNSNLTKWTSARWFGSTEIIIEKCTCANCNSDM